MDILVIKDSVVEFVSSVNSIEELQPYYPDHTLVERTGEEWEGWYYLSGVFYPPDKEVNKSSTSITKLAFLNRFTDVEAIAIDLAGQGNTQEAALLRRVQKKMDAVSCIDLSDPDTIYGVTLLENVGLIGADRAQEILSTNISTKERYSI